MFEKKDYSKLTLEELKLEKTKVKKLAILMSIICCLTVGASIYSFIYNKGSKSYFITMLICFFTANYLENLSKILKEIQSRG
jgi:hypothetical protein